MTKLELVNCAINMQSVIEDAYNNANNFDEFKKLLNVSDYDKFKNNALKLLDILNLSYLKKSIDKALNDFDVNNISSIENLDIHLTHYYHNEIDYILDHENEFNNIDISLLNF